MCVCGNSSSAYSEWFSVCVEPEFPLEGKLLEAQLGVFYFSVFSFQCSVRLLSPVTWHDTMSSASTCRTLRKKICCTYKSLFLFVFIQDQPSELGRHGSRAFYCCLPTSSSRTDLYCAASLRSHCSDLGRLLHPFLHRSHHPPRHPASLFLLRDHHLLPNPGVQHTLPQDT